MTWPECNNCQQDKDVQKVVVYNYANALCRDCASSLKTELETIAEKFLASREDK